ncbi:FAD-dependent oxidoreductase [Pseudogemmobacter bohemicus]|uniref:FAD-dependent oxidoreductase n=1 Tax=Pseudogemmobacter bohemicus TaxID=2250708 RepID=UPI000DD35B64|nr:NAD(P)/FAD-dependent oxidoreductase [Pseudogemmobacter bohemicus]
MAAGNHTGKALEIAVIGAGMGGLAAAGLLARDGHKVTLIERFAEPRALGSGLMIQPVGLAVLAELGLDEAARALGTPIRRMRGRSGRRNALDVHYPAAAPGLGMLRASLFHLLWQAMTESGVQLITGAEVTGTELRGEQRVMRSAAGAMRAFDFVVDASGAGSLLSPMKARPLLYGAIWGHVPWPEDGALPGDELRQRYFRASHMAGVLPIGRLPGEATSRAAVFWSMPRRKLSHWGEAEFAGWKAEVTAHWSEMAPFIAPIESAAQMTPAFYSHGTLRRPYERRLVFIGDSAHRASPQLGQGANMALLDALALRLALRQDLDDAPAAYARMRRWHVRLYQLLSAFLTPAYQSDSRLLPLLRDLVLAPASLVPPLPGLLTRLVAGQLIPPLASTRWP